MSVLNRLNYYSRYNRIRSPKQIQTLYHLLDDLNIDAVITDDLIQKVSTFRDEHILQRQYIASYRNNNKNNRNKNYDYILADDDNMDNQSKINIRESDGQYVQNRRNRDISRERIQHSRRFMSCDPHNQYQHSSSIRKQQIDKIDTNFNNGNVLPLRMNTSRQSGSNKNKYINENKTDRNSRKQQQSQKNATSSIRNSKPKTNNLSQMNCLQTQSIPDSSKSKSRSKHQHVDQQMESPIFRLAVKSNEYQMDTFALNRKRQGHDDHHEQIQHQDQKRIQINAIIEKVQDQQQQSMIYRNNNAQIIQIKTPKSAQNDKHSIIKNLQQGIARTSNFDDQISEGLAELHKVDDIRNSACSKAKNNNTSKNNTLEDCRSEKLQRLHGSDIQMDEIQQYNNQTNYQNKNSDNYDDQVTRKKILPSKNLEEAHQYFQDYHKFEAEANQQLNQHQQQDQQQGSDYDQKYKNQLASIDNRLQLNHNQIQKQIQTKAKIPSKGLTQGKWPIGITQKSIEGVVQHEVCIIPETNVNNIVQNNGNKQSSPVKNHQRQRKPFKKMIMDKKLNPRMVMSTIVTDIPVKKVNFKKIIKKQSAQNKIQTPKTPQNKKTKQIKPTQQRKQMLKAFFDQN